MASCSSALKTYRDHLSTPEPNKRHYLTYVLVTNDLAAVAHYNEGRLDYWEDPVASGSGTSYTNARRWNYPSSPPPPPNPFDPARVSEEALRVNLQTGEVSFGGTGFLPGECINGVIRGTIPGKFINDQFILSMKTGSTASNPA
jgi:hypothetical protein